MTRQELRDKTIQEANAITEQMFNYSLWTKLILLVLCPLGFLSIIFNRINVRKIHAIEDNNNLSSKQKWKHKLINYGINQLIALIIFIIAIVVYSAIGGWMWLFLYLCLGLSISWSLISGLHYYINVRIEKYKIREDIYINKCLREQKVPKLQEHIYLDFFGKLTSYCLFYELIQKQFEEKSKTLMPTSWKYGIIVNKEKNIMVPIDVWNMHFIFIGSSGFGKTYNILKLIFAAAYNKFPICILDGKADSKLEDYVKRICFLFNANCKVWSLKDLKQTAYNPFAQKFRIEIIDMLSEMFDYTIKKKNPTTGLYAGFVRQWITVLCDYFERTKKPYTFKNLSHYTKPGYLKNDLSWTILKENKINIKGKNSETFSEKESGLINQDPMMQKLNMLDLEQLKIIHNEIDEIQINTDGVVSESGFSIRDFMKANKNDVLLFKLHNVVTNHILERLLFYDWKISADYNEEQRAIDHKKTILIIDEASAVFQDQDQATDMAQQFRSKQICLGFGFQDKAGLESGGKIGLMSSLINNCSTFFISRIRDEQTRDAIVNIYGTKKDMMPTEQTTIDADGRVIHSGAGSLRVEESYVWNPNDIRKLRPGEIMFATLTKKVKNNWPDYDIEQVDEIISNLQVDNVVMTIEEFEKIKFAKFKPDTKQEIKETTQLTTPISSTKTSEISESLQKQIKKIRTMSDSQWNVYRKNKWNTYLQKKKEPYREIEAWYLKTRDEHIDNLVKFSQIQKTTISEFETNTKKQFTDPISS